MKNKNKPAFPLCSEAYKKKVGYGISEGDASGLTIRQYAAIKAMQGVLAACETGIFAESNIKEVAAHSIKYADELLKQLEQ